MKRVYKICLRICALFSQIGELTTVIENQQAEIKKQAEGLELKTKQMQESTSRVMNTLLSFWNEISILEGNLEV